MYYLFFKNGGKGLKSRRKVFDFNSFHVPRRCGTRVERGWNGVEQDFEIAAVNYVMSGFTEKRRIWLFHAMGTKKVISAYCYGLLPTGFTLSHAMHEKVGWK